MGIFSLYRTLVRPILNWKNWTSFTLRKFYFQNISIPRRTFPHYGIIQNYGNWIFQSFYSAAGGSRVLKWARFFSPLGSTSGLDADWLARRQQSRSLFVGEEQITRCKWRRTTVGFSCLTWFFGLFAGTVISVRNAYAGCGRTTLNFIERF